MPESGPVTAEKAQQLQARAPETAGSDSEFMPPGAMGILDLQRKAGNRAVTAAIREGAMWSAPGGRPMPMLQLMPAVQRWAGNRAAVALRSSSLRPARLAVQREEGADDQGIGTDEQAMAAKKPGRPDWSKLSSGQGAPPGEYLQDIPNTRAGRDQLDGLFMKRHNDNVARIEEFTDVVSEAVLDVWTRFVTERMRDAAEEGRWPVWADALAFATSAAIVAGLGALAKWLVSVKLPDKARDALGGGLGIGGAALENEMQRGKLRQRSGELQKQSTVPAKIISSVLKPYIRVLADDTYYRELLDKLPDEDLHVFRLPYLIPKADAATVRTGAAQALVGKLQGGKPLTLSPARNPLDNSRDITHEQRNVIEMRLQATAFGKLKVERGPTMKAASALRKEIVGKPIRSLPNVPLMIQVYGQPELVRQSMLDADQPSPRYAETGSEIASAYPSKSPLYIERRADGTVDILGGGLADHLHVYERLHRDLNVAQFMLPFARRVDPADEPVSRADKVTPGVAARDVFQELLPDLKEAARLFIDESVEPLDVSKY